MSSQSLSYKSVCINPKITTQNFIFSQSTEIEKSPSTRAYSSFSLWANSPAYWYCDGSALAWDGDFSWGFPMCRMTIDQFRRWWTAGWGRYRNFPHIVPLVGSRVWGTWTRLPAPLAIFLAPTHLSRAKLISLTNTKPSTSNMLFC